jgi:multicomponent K+:H+ antiporter subunit D
MRAGIHYVVINLVSSALFLVAAGLLYGVAGTLNMADLALKVAALAPEEAVLARVAALLLLMVFATKAAVFPLYFWLPQAYPAAPAPVAALFSVMTKVGVYAILRVYPLIFGEGAGMAAHVASPLILVGGLVTLGLGTLGALASDHLRGVIAYLTVASVGTLLTAAGLFTGTGLSAAMFYMAHSILVIAALFLLADLISVQRGGEQDRLMRALPVAQPALLGTLYFVGALAVVGLPPFGGFLGKVMVLREAASFGLQIVYWIWGTILVTSLLGLIAMARVGSLLFWNVRGTNTLGVRAPPMGAAAAAGLMAWVAAITLLAAPLKAFTDAAAGELLSPGGYIRAVLGQPEGREAP